MNRPLASATVTLGIAKKANEYALCLHEHGTGLDVHWVARSGVHPQAFCASGQGRLPRFMEEFKNLVQFAEVGGGEPEFAIIVSAAQAAASWHPGLRSGPTAAQGLQLCRGHDDGPTSLLGDNWWGHLDRD